MDVVIRDASEADLDRISEIYDQTIVDNHVSFDTEPWDAAKRRAWWEERPDDLPCLVVEGPSGTVLGMAYASRWKPKTAYRGTAETTIVLDRDATGRGIGTSLLNALIERLRTAGFHRAVAVVALPNDASIALHLKLGYRVVGTLSEVGHKLGRHWDTMLLECPLDPQPADAPTTN